MTKILVTGSAGVIGKALLASLENNFETCTLDFRYLNDAGGFGDIRNYEDIERSIKGCDGVVHLAAVARVGEAEQQPDLCWDINVNGTFNLLQAALKLKKRPWFIFASSREVYGQQAVLPVKENTLPNPLNTYAKSKAKAEAYCLQVQEQGLKLAIIRFANVFGSLEDYVNRVIPAFCRAALQGAPLYLQGPQNVFDFIHIDDVVHGLLQAITYICQAKGGFPPLHFTTGVGTEIKALAKQICKLANSISPIIEMPARTCDIHCFYGDATFTQHILGWKPRLTLEAGLQKFLHDLQSTLTLTQEGGIYESP